MFLHTFVARGAIAVAATLLARLAAPNVGHLAVIDGGLAHLPPMRTAATPAVVPPRPWLREDPADSLYRTARQALIDNDFARAARLFEEIVSRHPRSVYAADSLYYRGYALYRLGGEANLREAERVLRLEQQRHPKAATIGDANELLVRVRGALAQRGDARSAEAVSQAASQAATTRCTRSADDESMRTEALNALLQMDAAGAVPILAQVMQKRDDCSAQLRKRAVFLLSQKATGEAVALLIRAANDDPAREVRSDAVFWLGQTRSEQATGALEQIALRSPDMALRDKAIFALAQQGSARGAALLRQIAEGDDTPRRLREQAIFQLGQRGSQANAEYLRDLFAKLPRGEEALKKNVLFSLSQMRGFGNDRWLLTVGLDEAQTVDVRKHAFFTAGQNGVGGSALATIYDQVRTPEIKEQLIWVMSQSSDRAGADKLVQIAKTDPNREMRKKALFWLGQMNDPRIKQIIADLILNG